MHASIQKSVSVVVESLESRQMMSAGPLASQLNATSHNGQAQLQIFGTAKSDSIFVTSTAAGVKVTMNGKVQTVAGTFDSIYVHGGRGNDAVTLHSSIKTDAIVYGGHGDDTLAGGAGNDKFYGQAGNDSVHGGAGDDVIVSIGDSTTDKATGGAGFDSFWVDQAETVTDASLDETAGGNVHRVANFNSFATTRKGAPRALRVGIDLNGGDLADPIAQGATYQSFATNRLFADAGPSADDVAQGYVGDCWFLATLSSVARTNQNAIRQSVVELGDGTFAVQFANPDGSKAFVRVDADLPVSAWGGMEYAQLGAQDSVWVAVMEKAYAAFRNAGPASYAQLDGGWMSEACDDLGFASDDFWSIASGETLFDLIAGELAAGQAVTIAINQPQNGARLIGYHAYDVVSVDTDQDGTRTLVVRNPWGIDGVGSDGANDGYVRLSALQAITSYWAITSAKVA